MPNYSHIEIIGHLGRDAESRAAGTDTVVSFSIAVTRKRKDKESTTWFNCAWFGKRATNVMQYLTKGKAILVSGELFEEEYQGKDGTAKKSLKVDVRDVVLLGSKEDAGSTGQVRTAVASAALPTPTHAQSAGNPDDSAPF